METTHPTHPLREYRRRLGLKLHDVADKAGTTKATLSRIENWKFKPSMALAGKIKAATDGAVTADDFIEAAE